MTYIDVGAVVITTGVHTHTLTNPHATKAQFSDQAFFFFVSILHCIVPHDVILGRIKLGNTSKLTKTNIKLNPYAI